MKKLRRFSLLVALLSFIIAAFLFIAPTQTLQVIVSICAALAIIKGLFDLYTYFKLKKRLPKAPTFRLITAVITIVLGFFLLFAPQFGVAFVAVIFAIWFLADVLSSLYELLQSPQKKDLWYWIAFFFHIISLLFAILLLIRPFYAVLSLSLLLAFYFLFQGIALIIGYFVLRNVQKEMQHA